MGCGWGGPMKTMQLKKQFDIVGADIFMPYLKQAKLNKTHDEYVLCDVRKLPFKPKSFDTVLCMEVIEHSKKGEGIKPIEESEKIARKRVIITTSVGFLQQDPYDINPYQEHKSSFLPGEFFKMGYNVRGFGIRINPLTFSSTYHRIFKRIFRVIFSPFSYYFPNFGERMICTKRVEGFSNKELGR